MGYSLRSLPYDIDALSPFMTARAISIHYARHRHS
ncbi:hypothetical protein [Methyloversatilis discipulorum]